MRPKFLLKGAVVAMAAFGAFAFNGNTQKNSFNEYVIHEQGQCTDLVEASCSEVGNFDCMIIKDEELKSLFDTECTEPIKHSSPSAVDWR